MRTTRVCSVLLIFSSAFFISYSAIAAVGQWSSQGPDEPGQIQSVAISPSNPMILYAGGSNGSIFRSDNGGMSWQSRHANIATLGLNGLAIDPNDPNIVYAQAFGLGLIKSTDGGQSWSESSEGLAATYNIIRIAPSSPNILYASGQFGLGLFKSTDSGANWVSVAAAFNSFFVVDIAIDPRDADTVYASANNGNGLYKTTDGGVNWTLLDIEPSGNAETVSAVEIDPNTPDTVYAVLSGSTIIGGLFKSTNGGTSWDPVNTGLAGFVSGPLSVNAASTVYVFMSNTTLARSLDGGSNWTSLATVSSSINGFVTDPSNSLYLAMSDGMLISRDMGAVFNPGNTGIIQSRINALGVHPARPEIVYAGTTEGLFRSPDGGQSWFFQDFDQGNQDIAEISFDPQNPDIVYVGIGTGNGIPGYVSRNSGAGWTPFDMGFGTTGNTPAFNLIEVDPTNANVIYVVPNGDLFKSTDGGVTATSIMNQLPGLVQNLVIRPDNPNILFAATASGPYRSDDGGMTWNLISVSNLTSVVPTNKFLIDPNNSNVMYAATLLGVSKSIDGGNTWVDTNAGLSTAGPATDIEINPVISTELYIRTSLASIFRSTDGGLNWVPFPQPGLPILTVINPDIQVTDTGTFTNIYLGTAGAGVFDFRVDKRNSITDFGIDPMTLPMLDSTQVAAIEPDAFSTFDADNVSQIPPEALAGLTPEQITRLPPEAIKGLTPEQFRQLAETVLAVVSSDQIGKLPKDILNSLTREELAMLNPEQIRNADGNTLSRLLLNVERSQISPADVQELLPSGWGVDLTTGALTIPPGTPLSLTERARPTVLPTNVTLPDSIPNLKTNLGLGGMVEVDGQAAPTILDQMGTVLAGIGLSDITLDQTEEGVLMAEGLGSQLTFIIDIENAMQIDNTNISPGLSQSVDGSLVFITPDGQQLPIIPAPKDLSSLSEALDGVEIRLGEDGDVLVFNADGTVRGVFLFDPTINLATNGQAGIFSANSARRTTSGSQVVNYNDGTSQTIYPYIPEPDTFVSTTLALDPAIESVVVSTVNGTATVTISGDPTAYLFIPQSTVQASDATTPSVIVNADISLDYAVEEGSVQLLTDIAFSP
ncbi:MAG: hypothetical protein AAF512_03190 [Pseudomonadota bacterium]